MKAWMRRAEELKRKNPSKEYGGNSIARDLQKEGFTVSDRSVRRWLSTVYKGEREIANADRVTGSVDHESEGDRHRITTRSRDIQSPQQALAAIGVDYDTVRIVKQRVSTSEVTVAAANSGTGKPETYTNFHVYVEWKKDVWRDGLLEYIENRTQPVKRKPAKIDMGGHLLIPSFYDLHWGKLAWAPETGSDYDIKIVNELFLNAIDVMVAKVRHFGVSEICLPIGQDFLHINNPENTTAAGTPQDVDSRLVKIIDKAVTAVEQAVEILRGIAPVRIVWVPGNHDPQTSYYLCKILEAVYRNCDDVVVDCRPTCRKFLTYGVNVIGMTHGSEEKISDLPLIMATEPELKTVWAHAQHREWHIGHLHKKREMQTVTADSFGPVIVRMIPSLSATDAWHFKKGYVNGRRAAEAFLYHEKTGYAGHVSANFEELK